MKVNLHLVGEEVEAVVNTRASASVVGKCLVCKFGIGKRARKFKVKQKDGCLLEGNFVVNTIFKVKDSSLVLGKLGMNADVSDIGNTDISLQLSWLTENEFLVDT